MTRSRKYNELLLERRLMFREEFCEELDIFDSCVSYPEWVYRYREPLLDKISSPVKQLARLLKDCDVRFKMKWPLRVGDNWKFADIYIPATETVIVVTTKADYKRPSLFMNERAEFFRQTYNVRQFDYDVFDKGHEELVDLIAGLTDN